MLEKKAMENSRIRRERRRDRESVLAAVGSERDGYGVGVWVIGARFGNTAREPEEWGEVGFRAGVGYDAVVGDYVVGGFGE